MNFPGAKRHARCKKVVLKNAPYTTKRTGKRIWNTNGSVRLPSVSSQESMFGHIFQNILALTAVNMTPLF